MESHPQNAEFRNNHEILSPMAAPLAPFHLTGRLISNIAIYHNHVLMRIFE